MDPGEPTDLEPPRFLKARPGRPAGAERFDAKTTVLMESVTHHIEEEEQDWFPKGRAGLGRKRPKELGAQLEQAGRRRLRRLTSPGKVSPPMGASTSLE